MMIFPMECRCVREKMDAKDVVEEFAVLMPAKEAEAFRQWGKKWITHWTKSIAFLAPEIKHAPWIMFQEQLSVLTMEEEWHKPVLELWNRKYGRNVPPINFTEF